MAPTEVSSEGQKRIPYQLCGVGEAPGSEEGGFLGHGKLNLRLSLRPHGGRGKGADGKNRGLEPDESHGCAAGTATETLRPGGNAREFNGALGIGKGKRLRKRPDIKLQPARKKAPARMKKEGDPRC